ncbi:hypothetical protein G4B88_027836 [Cannabis sativa]|uniref:Uncharacterized protein n=1 Tax=Cannabis sativa TaxID=3483 RepID=A0A7J6I7C8_CANSA|nr:hypothetical protein G4B88_027836 [Cannabis sativa]
MFSFSVTSPFGNFQLKAWTRVAVSSWTMRKPKLIPAHILRPAPNGLIPCECGNRLFRNPRLPSEEGTVESMGVDEMSLSQQLEDMLVGLGPYHLRAYLGPPHDQALLGLGP